jgi:hypothetical protein
MKGSIQECKRHWTLSYKAVDQRQLTPEEVPETEHAHRIKTEPKPEVYNNYAFEPAVHSLLSPYLLPELDSIKIYIVCSCMQHCSKDKSIDHSKSFQVGNEAT